MLELANGIGVRRDGIVVFVAVVDSAGHSPLREILDLASSVGSSDAMAEQVEQMTFWGHQRPHQPYSPASSLHPSHSTVQRWQVAAVADAVEALQTAEQARGAKMEGGYVEQVEQPLYAHLSPDSAATRPNFSPLHRQEGEPDEATQHRFGQVLEKALVDTQEGYSDHEEARRGADLAVVSSSHN